MKPKLYTKFTDDHLPRAHDWRSGLPQTNPAAVVPAVLGPPRKKLTDQTLLEAYFGHSILPIELDMLRRPSHYTPRQREIIEKLKGDQQQDPDVDYRDINEIVIRFTEPTKQAQAREKIVERAKKKIEDSDPTVERMNEEEQSKPPTIDDMTSAKDGWIKII